MPSNGYFVKLPNHIWTRLAEEASSAFAEYCWFVDATTEESPEEDPETHMVRGIVLGGKPIPLKDIATELGRSWSTVQRNVKTLVEKGFIISYPTKFKESSYEVATSFKFNNREIILRSAVSPQPNTEGEPTKEELEGFEMDEPTDTPLSVSETQPESESDDGWEPGEGEQLVQYMMQRIPQLSPDVPTYKKWVEKADRELFNGELDNDPSTLIQWIAGDYGKTSQTEYWLTGLIGATNPMALFVSKYAIINAQYNQTLKLLEKQAKDEEETSRQMRVLLKRYRKNDRPQA